MKALYYVAVAPREGKYVTAMTLGFSRDEALRAIRQQDTSARIVGPALRWRWAARLAAWYLRRHPALVEELEQRANRLAAP